MDSSGFHGTHVAGIIGATTDNRKEANGLVTGGIAGVNWACKILPVRALGITKGKGNDFDIAAAIRWAAGIMVADAPDNPNPAKIINLSFGGPGAGQVLTEAIQAALARGVMVVAAAGNQGQEGSNIYPAAVSGVIAVGATKFDGKRAYYSNFGNIVALMAPGGNMAEKLPYQYDGKFWEAGILSTLYSRTEKAWTYHMYEGTSQASPLVAGVISLMLAINSHLDQPETLNILQSTADPKGKCNEGCGAGLINAAAALAKTKGIITPGTKGTFGALCSKDSECTDNVCRVVDGSSSICTQFCSIAANCPGSVPCINGLCVPKYSQANTCNGSPCEITGTIEGVSCSTAAPGGADADGSSRLLLVLLAGIGLSWIAARRRRRP
jgi:subtilisin family serine protease